MAVIATGFFDGVHQGHRLVIDTLLSEARAKGEQSVVVTFWPHPRAVLHKDDSSLRLLMSRASREAMILSLGVDRLETIEFSPEFASLSALDYIRMLREGYGCTALVLGYDTRFGSEQAGPQTIADLARGEGMDAVIVPPVNAPDSDMPISSTLIRTALEEGDAQLAAELLGRPYEIDGVVVTGNRLGRTIGFPTANMAIDEPLLLIPCGGVYRSSVVVKGVAYDGMTNIGTRPTVGGSGTLTVETHIFDFDEMIYGERISVSFLERIRDERRFPSLDALRAQLRADAELIRG
jgi:riboflavin kinase/FMN adenylyltransferase